MSLNKRSLVLFCSTPYGTAGKTINWYKYATADAASAVLTAGYFNDVRDKLNVNDVIEIMSVADGTGDILGVKVTAAPKVSGDVTIAVNTEASGS